VIGVEFDHHLLKDVNGMKKAIGNLFEMQPQACCVVATRFVSIMKRGVA
jgi:hypothetical protein